MCIRDSFIRDQYNWLLSIFSLLVKSKDPICFLLFIKDPFTHIHYWALLKPWIFLEGIFDRLISTNHGPPEIINELYSTPISRPVNYELV